MTLGKKTIPVRAREIQDFEEYQQMFDELVRAYENYANYRRNTGRRMPIFLLEPTRTHVS